MNASVKRRRQVEEHENALAAQARFLQQISEHSGHSISRMAEQIGSPPSTLTRHAKGTGKSIMHGLIIQRLVNAYGVSPPPILHFAGHGTASGFGEAEVAPLAPPGEGAETLPPSQSDWTVGDTVLQQAGYLPGDRVRIDQTVEARVGDIVIAQDKRAGSGRLTRTIFRKYDPPYLVAATAAPSGPKPIPVDNDTVYIVGVVIKSWRERTP